jgi:hypothetical protein
MQLLANFLFIHPNYKRLIDFLAETVMLNFVKYYKKFEIKQQINELNELISNAKISNENNTDLADLEVFVCNFNE